MALPKCFCRKLFASFSFFRRRFTFFFVIISSLCCVDLLRAFNINNNRFMETDNGIPSAYTNDPIPLMAMPHSPTAAEESPHDFWHENKPFVHIHGEAPHRHTMRHQHFAHSYYDNAFGNFITDPPGMGLNAPCHQTTPEGENGLLKLLERNMEGKAKSALTTLVGDEEESSDQKGENDWSKAEGGAHQQQEEEEEKQLSIMFGRHRVFDESVESIIHSSPNGGYESKPSTSSNSATLLSRQIMEPILRFYHRPKSQPKMSKVNLSPPTIIVPTSSSTVEEGAAKGQLQKATEEGQQSAVSIVDADIPFFDAQPIKLSAPLQRNRLGQANGHLWEAAKSDSQIDVHQHKSVLKADIVSPTTFSSSAEMRTTIVKTGDETTKHCGDFCNCQNTKCQCLGRFSNKCCCRCFAGTDTQTAHIWLTIRCCYRRHSARN